MAETNAPGSLNSRRPHFPLHRNTLCGATRPHCTSCRHDCYPAEPVPAPEAYEAYSKHVHCAGTDERRRNDINAALQAPAVSHKRIRESGRLQVGAALA